MQTILAARSTFSIGESILTVEELIEQARAVGATAVALTDTMSVTGLIDFTNRAKKAEVKPIIGCRLRISDDVTWRKTKESKRAPPEYYLTYYVLSEKGLVALFKLLSLANSEERFYYTSKLSLADLWAVFDDLGPDDAAIASGDMQSMVAHPKAATIFRLVASHLTAANVYMTLSPINSPYYDTMNSKAIEIADAEGFPTLVTRPVIYGRPKDGEVSEADAKDVMNAVSSNTRLSELWVQAPVFRNLYPLDDRAMMTELAGAAARLHRRGIVGAGKHLKEGIVNTDAFVDRVGYVWSKAKVSLPKMADDEYAALVSECKKGWSARLGQETFGHRATSDELVTIYKPRLMYELSVLKKLGFSGYFLLVQDIVNYAKTNGIRVGAGRGSVGGSLVAYLIGITDCDPIRFGLIFERFINPDRIDLPDADLDFMSERRHEIIDYLTNKYGAARVAGISNFSELAAASAIRNIGKAFGLSEDDYRCSKFTPKAHGANIPLPEAADKVSEIAAFRDKYRPIWDVMVRLEGVMTNYGRHAAGVVVGGCDLVERGVVEIRKPGEATLNWDKRIVEDQGLVKVDVLGLSTLDLIELTLKYIGKRHGKHLDMLRISLNDEKVLANFASGKTTGIFQFSSGGMRRLLKELGADGAITFEDITAATALYRPGPMESGMMDSYFKRKQGIETIEYDHPLLEAVLKETYGVFVYQEGVMQASRVIAGYSGPDADKLRKIMGKKLPEEMKKERGKFQDGCVATIGCTPEWAANLFDKIEGFAGYGFNKAHSIAYSLISYQVMYLKTNYPVEFFAAALSLMKAEELPAILKDAANFGIEIALPDINLSTGEFEILTDTLLCIPFNRIKGIADRTTKAILTARAAGPFRDIADLNARVEKRACHKGHVEILNKIGAFAQIEPGQNPTKHPDRIKDQRDLIPGLITDTVPIRRGMSADKYDKAKIGAIVGQYRVEKAEDGTQVKPFMGKNAKFMVISDCPTGPEEREGVMSIGQSFSYTAEALSEAGLARIEGYWTAMVKRPKEGKQLTAKEIDAYLPYLKQEIDVLKPPVIVLLGTATVRHFIPDLKGKASDHAGKIVYNKELDANMIIGFNSGEIYHDPDKQIALNEVFAAAASLTE